MRRSSSEAESSGLSIRRSRVQVPSASPCKVTPLRPPALGPETRAHFEHRREVRRILEYTPRPRHWLWEIAGCVLALSAAVLVAKAIAGFFGL